MNADLATVIDMCAPSFLLCDEHQEVKTLFEQCVIKQSNRTVLDSVLRTVIHVFLNECEPQTEFELCGSASFGGLWYGSDIDLRYVGFDLVRFFDLASQFVRMVGSENDFFWTGNLLTINVLECCIKVDILIVNDIPNLVQLSQCHLSDNGLHFRMVNLYNIQHVPLATPRDTSVFQYDPAKSAAFRQIYWMVCSDIEWRSLLLLLKSIDTEVPTCMLSLMVGLAAFSHSVIGLGTDKWRYGLEIVNRFFRMFVPMEYADDEFDCPGMAEVFEQYVWLPFCRGMFAETTVDVEDPLSLFTVSQNTKLENSVLGYVICQLACPASCGFTPMLSVPRPLSPYIIHHAVDFIIASSVFSELDLRRSTAVALGLHHLALRYACESWDCDLSEWLSAPGFGEDITPCVLERLHELVNAE
jgi:hypothetical protein